jgi:hypothetical protein
MTRPVAQTSSRIIPPEFIAQRRASEPPPQQPAEEEPPEAPPRPYQYARELGIGRDRKAPTISVGETRRRIQRKKNDRISHLNYEVPTVTTLRGKAGKDASGNKIPPVRGTTNVQWAPGMEDIAKTLIGMEKDLKVIRSATCVRGATEWTRKRGGEEKGWNVHYEDIAGCEEPEVFVTNPKGEIVMVNGMKLVPSKHAERQLYSVVNTGRNKEERKYTTPRHLRERAHRTVQNPDGSFSFDNEAFPVEILQYADRVRNKLRARDVFRQYVFDHYFKQYEMHHQLETNRKYTGLVKARIIRNASSTLYRVEVEFHLVAEYRRNNREEPHEIDLTDINNPDVKAILTRVRRSVRYEDRARDWVTDIIKRMDSDDEFRESVENNAMELIHEQVNLELGTDDQQRPRLTRNQATRERLERGMAERRRRLRPQIIWLPGEDPVEDQTRDDTGRMRSVVEQRRREPPPEDEYDDEPPNPINPQLQNITEEEFLQDRRRPPPQEDDEGDDEGLPALPSGHVYKTSGGEIVHSSTTGLPIIIDPDGNEHENYEF